MASTRSCTADHVHKNWLHHGWERCSLVWHPSCAVKCPPAVPSGQMSPGWQDCPCPLLGTLRWLPLHPSSAAARGWGWLPNQGTASWWPPDPPPVASLQAQGVLERGMCTCSCCAKLPLGVSLGMQAQHAAFFVSSSESAHTEESVAAGMDLRSCYSRANSVSAVPHLAATLRALQNILGRSMCTC